jgi:hypothetical protein
MISRKIVKSNASSVQPSQAAIHAIPTRLTRYPELTQNRIVRAGYAHADAAFRRTQPNRPLSPVTAPKSFSGVRKPPEPAVKPGASRLPAWDDRRHVFRDCAFSIFSMASRTKPGKSRTSGGRPSNVRSISDLVMSVKSIR